MTCCGDDSITTAPGGGPPPPPPIGSDGCLRIRYVCECVLGTDTWSLHAGFPDCVSNDLCTGQIACTDKDATIELFNQCIIGAPVPVVPDPAQAGDLVLNIALCAPSCCPVPDTPPTTTTTPPPTTPPPFNCCNPHVEYVGKTLTVQMTRIYYDGLSGLWRWTRFTGSLVWDPLINFGTGAFVGTTTEEIYEDFVLGLPCIPAGVPPTHISTNTNTNSIMTVFCDTGGYYFPLVPIVWGSGFWHNFWANSVFRDSTLTNCGQIAGCQPITIPPLVDVSRDEVCSSVATSGCLSGSGIRTYTNTEYALPGCVNAVYAYCDSIDISWSVA